MLRDKGILKGVDYRAREAIRLLNEFDRVDTYQACAGHIEDGRVPIQTRYVPGLAAVDGHYELDGNPIELDELTTKTDNGYRKKIEPLARIYEDDHIGLSFISSFLEISRFEPNDNRTRELGRMLENLYRSYRPFLDIRPAEPPFSSSGFRIPPKQFIVPIVDFQIKRDILDKYGTLDIHWSDIIDDLVTTQEYVDQLWRDIENTCRELLEN